MQPPPISPEQQKENYKRKLSLRIMELCNPTKQFTIPELMKHHEDQLIEIGKTAKALHDKMEKYGFIKPQK